MKLRNRFFAYCKVFGIILAAFTGCITIILSFHFNFLIGILVLFIFGFIGYYCFEEYQ